MRESWAGTVLSASLCRVRWKEAEAQHQPSVCLRFGSSQGGLKCRGALAQLYSPKLLTYSLIPKITPWLLGIARGVLPLECSWGLELTLPGVVRWVSRLCHIRRWSGQDPYLLHLCSYLSPVGLWAEPCMVAQGCVAHKSPLAQNGTREESMMSSWSPHYTVLIFLGVDLHGATQCD